MLARYLKGTKLVYWFGFAEPRRTRLAVVLDRPDLGRGQVARRQTLDLFTGGSNPSAPAKYLAKNYLTTKTCFVSKAASLFLDKYKKGYATVNPGSSPASKEAGFFVPS